jgi:hypothetical protein
MKLIYQSRSANRKRVIESDTYCPSNATPPLPMRGERGDPLNPGGYNLNVSLLS